MPCPWRQPTIPVVGARHAVPLRLQHRRQSGQRARRYAVNENRADDQNCCGRPDHGPPGTAPPVLYGDAGGRSIFHQPPDDIHAGRDALDMTVTDRPCCAITAHVRHPPDWPPCGAERPPRRHFHDAAAVRTPFQHCHSAVVRQQLRPRLDAGRRAEHVGDRGADAALVECLHQGTVATATSRQPGRRCTVPSSPARARRDASSAG